MIVAIGGSPRDLGAWKPSSLGFAAAAWMRAGRVDVAALPMQFTIDGFPVDYDQGELGSCGPNSAAEVYEYDLHAKFSRLFAYWLTRAAEHDVDDDGGVELPDMMNLLHVCGMPLESDWDYHPEAFKTVPPPRAWVDALAHRLTQWDVVPDLDHALREISQKQPVTLGFNVPASMQLEDCARTGLVKVPSSADPCIGGHAVNAIGFDRVRELVKCTCHYGPAFGDGGTIWLPFAMFTSGNVRDMCAMRSIS